MKNKNYAIRIANLIGVEILNSKDDDTFFYLSNKDCLIVSRNDDLNIISLTITDSFYKKRVRNKKAIFSFFLNSSEVNSIVYQKSNGSNFTANYVSNDDYLVWTQRKNCMASYPVSLSTDSLKRLFKEWISSNS